MVCWVCGNSKSEKAHVKARGDFENPDDPRNDFKNIIPLCPNHHREYFDATPKGKMAINKRDQTFIILHSIYPKKIIEEKPVQFGIIDIKDEYILWKNYNCHCYLKAILRKKGLM